MDIRKQYTDDPILDEIIYDVSIMSCDCILKNPTEVENNETLESLKNFELYESCLNGTVRFELFEYDEEDLKACPFVPNDKINYYLIFMEELNQDAKNYMVNRKSSLFLNSYEEMNNYYRCLNGLPDYETKGLLLRDCGIDFTQYGINNNPLTTYIQDLDRSDIDLLEAEGILDKIYNNNKKYKYVKFLGKRKIDIYSARKSLNFSVLYIPQSSNSEIYIKFLERLDINRSYFISCFYSDSYKLDNDYFDSYMIFMIIINSMLDMITLSHEFIIKREIFDLRTVQHILESNGVKFFSDIPIKYQKRLVRNLNVLIKYKSSDKNIIDICSLFGFDDIESFKYYLHKNRNIDDKGNYIIKTKIDDDGNEVEDTYNNYNLKFIRVPMDGNIDDSIRNPSNYFSYDEIISNDPTWNGPYSHEYVKRKIIDQEFNTVRTKYISINTITEMTNLSFELPYFINMIMNIDNNKISTSKLSMYCTAIHPTSSFNIMDIFVYLYCLMYAYYNIEDTIIYDKADIMYIKGFNFNADMDALASYVAEQRFTLKDLGVDGFMVPSKYLSFNQLLTIYTNNKNIHDHLLKCIHNAPNKRMYTIYKTIYDSLMISEVNKYMYRLPDGNVAKTYSEYLKFKNVILYNSIQTLKNVEEFIKEETISLMINSVCDTVYQYLETEDLRYIFSNLPSVSIDHVRKYMEEVISFFKSYRITMLDVGSIYKIKDHFKPTIIDEVLYTSNYDLKLMINELEKVYMNSSISYNDKMQMIDKIYIDIYRLIEKQLIEQINIDDVVNKLNTIISKNELVNINDVIYQLSRIVQFNDGVVPVEKIKYLNILLNKLDRYYIQDTVYINVSTFKDLYIDSIFEANNIEKEKIPVIDKIYRIVYTED